jgi:hypothetical protein
LRIEARRRYREDSMKTTQSDVFMQWENVGGAEVLKVWKLEGKEKYPQIAVMRMSNSDYLKFAHHQEGFKSFVNQHEVFSKPIITAGPWVTLSSVDEQKNQPPDWVVVMVHGKMSTMIVAALPQLLEEKVPSKRK